MTFINMNKNNCQYTVRQVTESDLPALTDIKPPMALHKDRFRDADGEKILYLVVEDSSTVIGFGLLVFERPAIWSDANDKTRLPAMVDLFIRPNCRNRGAGTCLISWMEEIVRSRGNTHLYLGVNPVENSRAYKLYLRLGFKTLQTKPYRSNWKFTDSDENVYEGNEWNIDMVKVVRHETAVASNNCVKGRR